MSQRQRDCLSAETIASFVEGRLDPEGARTVAEHIARCDACILLVRTVAAFERENRIPAKMTIRGWTHFAALRQHYGVVALLLVVASSVFLLWQWSRMREPMTRLASAVAGSKQRPTEARISLLPYAPASTPRGGADFSDDVKRHELHKVANGILEQKPAAGDAASIRARGVAWLVTGSATRAVDELSRAVALAPTEPQYWNDLAAARYTLGNREQDPHQLVEALANADESLRRSPASPEALFNRALILESLDLSAPAIAAYERYLSADPSSQWAVEARARIATLKSRTMRNWDKGRPLFDAVSAGDAARVSAIVTEFRQESRSSGETIFLRDWAVALDAGHASAAAAKLRAALLAGEALSEQTGERLLLDAATAVSQARQPSAVAAAYRAYDDGRALYNLRRSGDALPLFERAAATFAREGSPMSGMAEYYRAACLFDLNDVDTSSKALDRLYASTPAYYAALRAQIWWQRGTAHARAGRLYEAIDCYARARTRFAAAGEHRNVALLGNSIAAIEATLGRHGEAWRERLEVFREFSYSTNAAGLQLACELAARTEALSRRWDTARSLLTLSLDPALRSNSSLTVNAFIWRALAADRLGDHVAAIADLSAARRALADVRDPTLRAAAVAQADFVKARVFAAERPAHALQLLTSMIARTTEARNYFLLPEAYLERGRLYRRLGDDVAAMRDLRAALASLDARRGTPADAFRDTYFATGAAAATELADLVERHGQVGNALSVIEAARARSIADRMGVAFPIHETGQFAAPEGVLIAVYTVLDQRVVIFTIEGTDVGHRDVAVVAARLDTDVRLMIDDPGSEDAVHASERLFGILINPIAAQVRRNRKLVIVPDEHLRGLPFAALRDRALGELMVHRISIVQDPSVGTYGVLAGRRTPSRGASSLLAIGNPTFNRERFPDLNQLPFAGYEVRQIASQYPVAVVFTARDATRAAFLHNAASATVIQIAAHAVQIAREPQMSFLVFAPDGEDPGLLYAHEIAKLDLVRAEIVVLAGCRTASRADAETDLTNLALAFLAAGVPNVVGTLWDVDDAVSHAFSIAFHRRLRSGMAPADALRQVQLEMACSRDPRLRPVSAWAAFQLIGSGS